MSNTINCFNCGHINPSSKQICESCGTPLLPESLGLSNEMKTQAIPSLDDLLRQDRNDHDVTLAAHFQDDGIAATEALNYDDILKAHPEFAALERKDAEEAAAKAPEAATQMLDIPETGLPLNPGSLGEAATQAIDVSDLEKLQEMDNAFSTTIDSDDEESEATQAIDVSELEHLQSFDLGNAPNQAPIAAPEPASGPSGWGSEEAEAVSDMSWDASDPPQPSSGGWGGTDANSNADWGASSLPVQETPAEPGWGAAEPEPWGATPSPPMAGPNVDQPLGAPPLGAPPRPPTQNNTSSGGGGGNKKIMIIGGVVLLIFMLFCCPTSIGGYYYFVNVDGGSTSPLAEEAEDSDEDEPDNDNEDDDDDEPDDDEDDDE